jgi:adhesin transport system membrane fusion protein
MALVAFFVWASTFRIDEVARASGEVIASSRVQVIQSVDGGVLAELRVREGDVVEAGQLIARLDQTRVGATLGEVQVRRFALQAKAARLRAEVADAPQPRFPVAADPSQREMVRLEEALFRQRKLGLAEEMRTLQVAVSLARRQFDLVRELEKSGDVSGTELLRVERELNDAEARLINRRNKFLEDARLELSKAEDDLGQLGQQETRRRQERDDSVFHATMRGVIKNVRVTTVGGVLRPGEEILQIVPLEDALVVEAKVSPADIARVRKGLPATVRFDPFDYTLHGGVDGKVIYVSADTLKEESSRGKEIYYRVHVSPGSNPVRSTTGRTLEIQPGMTAQVDIRTGDRTLLEYLLKPLRRTATEAFGER